ncbi:Rne/Rng family ribonuclease [Paraliobacillus ryukyuensis]|uniref:Rne/Rng family ribonuclease n=1 Tax=Paraliobacillus ryukyuensis TaxID=200904 RepID=UPI0009A5EBB3|nr:Rne/Rng family ribonuclease [Paraliobacillus ryukyuensis]
MVSLYLFNETTEKIGLAVKNDKVQELVIDRPDYPQQVGNIYLGKVKKVEKGLQAAFVDIGAEQDGFLQRKEIPYGEDKRIESVITEGQSLIVQVMKDAYATKGARLTANLTLPGQHLVYMPLGNQLIISKKLDSTAIEPVLQRLTSIRTAQEGAIIRTAAVDASSEVIEAEYLALRNQMTKLLQSTKNKEAPQVLFVDSVSVNRFIRLFSAREIDAIYVDSARFAKQLRAMYPSIASLISWKTALEQSLPTRIDQLWKTLLDPVVTLQNGISLSIEETEAMVVIDVNSGGFADRYHHQKTAVKTNLTTVPTIAEQIRLRNLSGIIVIDFIDMKEQKDQKQVIDALKKAFRSDRMQTNIYGFTKLGLLEITRKREAPSFAKLIADQSATKKNAYSTLSQVYSLERTIIRQQSSDVEAVLIQVEPKIRQLWDQVVDVNYLKDSNLPMVYFEPSKGVTGFHVKRAGSETLIEEYIQTHPHLIVDKVL